MIKYIILDVDRTLVNSFEPELLSFQEAIENIMGYRINEEQAKNFTTMPTTVFLKSLNLNNEQIKMIMNEWNVTFTKYKIHCFDGIKESISQLHKKGYIFGLITSRTLSEYHELDEELEDINELFKIIITSDMVKLAKPNPESMNYLCNQLKCKNEEIIYIGDSYIDKDFALNSNCLFIPACYDNKELSNEEYACFNPRDILDIVEIVSKVKEKTTSYSIK